MGNCGAKNIKRDNQVRKPMIKSSSNCQKENQAPIINIPQQQCKSVLQEKRVNQIAENEKCCSLPYFVPVVMNESLSEQNKEVFKCLTEKRIVDELLEGKNVMEIVGEQVVMMEEFSDLVAIINELVRVVKYFDKEKMKEISQVNGFIGKLDGLEYMEGHDEFVRFIEGMRKEPSYTSFEQARELECKTIYLLVETFAALQVLRNDCYCNERRHWWRLDQQQKLIEFNQNIITDDYLNYYLEKFQALANDYQDYINIEQEALKQHEEDQRKMEEEEEKNREIEEQKRIQEEEEARLREQEEKERIERELYEQEQERIRQEEYYNSLFDQEEEQASCKAIGDINNLQFHVKKQLIV